MLRFPTAGGRRWLPVFSALLMLAAPMRADDVPVAGTLPEDYIPGLRVVLQAALKQSPTMVSQAISVAQSQIAIMQADSRLYPSLSLGANYGVSKEEVSQTGVTSLPATPTTSLSYNASASQNLFSWGAIFNGSRIARISELIAERRYADAYLSLAAQLRDGYLGLITAKLTLRNDQVAYQQAEAALSIAQEKLKNGSISPASMSVPQLAEGDAHLAADRAEEEYAHAKRALALLAGLQEISDDDIPAEMPKPIYSEEKAKALLATVLQSGGRSLFQEQIYEMQIRADRLNFRIAATGLLPKFSIGAGYSLSNQTSLSETGVTPAGQPIESATQTGVRSSSYGINVGWSIFDGFATHAAKQAALESRRSDERALHDLVDSKLEEAQDLERQVNFTARAMDLADIRATIASSNVQQTADQLKLGILSQADLDNADVAMYYSQYAQAYARSLFFSKWCQLISLAGTDPVLNYLPIHYVRGTN